jgi:hypothetical protein
MTETDWALLCSFEDLHGELLTTVAQPRKLFLLGSAFLRRVHDLLPTEAERTAAETTEQFARGRASLRDLLETWTEAEASTRAGLWLDPASAYDLEHSWCPCCEPDMKRAEAMPIHPGVREAVRDPAWFAARMAWYARELVQQAAPTEQRVQLDLYRDIVGDPFEKPLAAPPWARHPAVRQLVTALDAPGKSDPVLMLALADAMEEAGCTESRLLEHCRGPGPHVRGCWLVALLQGRAALTLPLSDEPPRSCRRVAR